MESLGDVLVHEHELEQVHAEIAERVYLATTS